MLLNRERSVPVRILGMLVAVTVGLLDVASQESSQSSVKVAFAAQLKPLKLLTPDRIQALPNAEQKIWNDYLSKSVTYALNECKRLNDEVQREGPTSSRPAPSNNNEFELDSKVTTEWFTKSETVKLADVVLSYQTSTGGWSKTIDYSKGSRPVGTHWTSQNDPDWHYCGTLDNRSTTEQIRFLSYMNSAQPDDRYRDGVTRGIRWLLDAQFPSGGWPQVYPLEAGYHEAMTINDTAMLHAIQTLQAIGSGKEPYAWIDDQLRKEAIDAGNKGIDCLLQAQITIDGRPTVWCAQHDPLTLQPVAARLKEPASQRGGESAELVKFLMRDAPDTSPNTSPTHYLYS